MRIDSAAINLAAQYSRTEITQRSESLSLTIGTPPPRDAVQISDAGQAAATAATNDKSDDESGLDPRIALLKQLIERLTGRTIKLFKLGDAPPPADMPDPRQTSGNPPSDGYSLRYDYHASRVDTQQLQFTAEGVIRTRDGQEIKFNLAYQLEATQAESVDVSIRAGDAARQTKDPLVLNFDGNAAQLLDTTFSFDLNGDGKNENIAQLGGGSGFLALDKNANGTIDNGKELFGPASGNGYNELAAYDQDGNHFIDEADTIYSQLRIFRPGSENLATLKDAGVGAIYLGNTATPFDMAGGVVRASGVFIKEDGSVGTTQQIDLKV